MKITSKQFEHAAQCGKQEEESPAVGATKTRTQVTKIPILK